MPLPKRASKVDPEEIYSFEGNFSTENRSYARSAQDVATPKLGCGILGSLSVSSEKTEDKNSPPLTGAFRPEKRAQPTPPTKDRGGSDPEGEAERNCETCFLVPAVYEMF
jgi:hypothetical protein